MKKPAFQKSDDALNEELDELSGVLAAQGHHLTVREHFNLLVRRHLK
jgi:hypothetical protein